MRLQDVIEERFRRWRNHLLREQATPLFTLGLALEPDPHFVLCTVEDLSDAEIERNLECALALVRKHNRPTG